MEGKKKTERKKKCKKNDTRRENRKVKQITGIGRKKLRIRWKMYKREKG
jgi:hypothetical protein